MGPKARMSLLEERLHKNYGSVSRTSQHDSDPLIQDDGCRYLVEDVQQSPTQRPEEGEEEVDINVPPRTTLTRFWILLVFSLQSWLHSVLWNTWGPINESVEAAFPTWTPTTVAMTVNWTTIMFLVFVVPMCFAIQRCGLRNVVLLSSALMSFGTAIRCITTTIPWFTILCELCSVLIGAASTVILSGPSLIASDWFPQNERTTAVAVMMGASQLGGVGSYLEPLLVRLPSPDVSVEDIKQDIMILLYIGAGAAGALLLATIIYFPSKPSTPPSVTSSTYRLDICSGVISLVKNRDFLLLLFAYGVSIGPPIAWVAVLNYSLLLLDFHQDRAMWIGLSAVVSSSLFPIVYGCFIDRFQGHIRSSLVALMLAATVCFYWFLLLSYGIISASTWQVYVSVVGGLTFNYTTIPLFYELAVEVAYPVPEILVAGTLTAADNLTSTLFLLVFLIPNVGYQWMTTTLVLCCSVSIIPLLLAKIDYTRTNLDLAAT